MSDLQVFNNTEFGTVRSVNINGEGWLVAKDVAAILGYSEPTKAAREKVDVEDRGVSKIDTPKGPQNMTIINESGLYSLILSSKLPTARKFKRWVTSEVLPAIRRTGAYAVPQDYPSALRALADAEEQRAALLAENAHQKQVIADFEPIKQYIDTILESPGTMATTQIAADYDMSAKRLNKILFEAGVQHKVNGQWILYREHMGKGYTKSETIDFYHSDGTRDTRLQTRWSQKGRLFIHEILSSRGIKAVMDRRTELQ